MLGSKYVNNYCKESDEPYWIKTEVGDQDVIDMYKDNILQNNFIQKFKIIKNGVHFHFRKDIGELGGDN